jgi:hypothetical protein
MPPSKAVGAPAEAFEVASAARKRNPSPNPDLLTYPRGSPDFLRAPRDGCGPKPVRSGGRVPGGSRAKTQSRQGTLGALAPWREIRPKKPDR